MKQTLFFLLFLLSSARADRSPVGTTHRQLGTQDDIIDYTPTTVVTDDAAIDLDQKIFEDELNKNNDNGFGNAYHIYTLGAHSGTYATLHLSKRYSLNC